MNALKLLAVGAPLLASAQQYGQFDVVAGGTHGTADGVGTNAEFSMIRSAALDAGSETLYVGEDDGVRALDLSTGEVSHTTETALAAEGTAVSSDGATLYLAVSLDHVIYAVTEGATSVVVGSGASGTTDGTLLDGTLKSPRGVAMNPDVDTMLYIAAQADLDGTLRFANLATDELGTLFNSQAGGSAFYGLAFALNADSEPVLYVSANNQVLLVGANTDEPDENAVIMQIGGVENGHVDGEGEDARFDAPRGVAYDASTGLLYVADTGNDAIRVIDGTTVTSMPALISDPRAVAVAGGALYAVNEWGVYSVNTVDIAPTAALTFAPTSYDTQGSSSSLSAFSSLPEDVALLAVLGMVLGAAGLVGCASATSVSTSKPSSSSSSSSDSSAKPNNGKANKAKGKTAAGNKPAGTPAAAAKKGAKPDEVAVEMTDTNGKA